MELEFEVEYFLVLDFEATCWPTEKKRRRNIKDQEIIEFAAMLVRATAPREPACPTFRKFVRPVEENILDKYCVKLTGISQSDVDCASPLAEVLQLFEKFLDDCAVTRAGLPVPHNLILPVTCGDWDLGSILPQECHRKRIWPQIPPELWWWCNIKEIFMSYTQHPGCIYRMDIPRMLAHYHLQFDGHEHSGIVDVRNLVRLIEKMVWLYGDSCIHQTGGYSPTKERMAWYASP